MNVSFIKSILCFKGGVEGLHPGEIDGGGAGQADQTPRPPATQRTGNLQTAGKINLLAKFNSIVLKFNFIIKKIIGTNN